MKDKIVYLIIGVLVGSLLSAAGLYSFCMYSFSMKKDVFLGGSEVIAGKVIEKNYLFAFGGARTWSYEHSLEVLVHHIKTNHELLRLVVNRDYYARYQLLLAIKANELSERLNDGFQDEFAAFATEVCSSFKPALKSCEISELRTLLVAVENKDGEYIKEFTGYNEL